jgi:ring-1,2-phenylacetyl-CoA epoxidase subunit PaaD
VVTTKSAGAVINAWDIAAEVPDPELPMVTLADLGILRDVRCETDRDGDRVVVTVTPTYSGCPAMREISHDICHRLEEAGYDRVTIRTELSPPWTSDWITSEGRRKLAAAGIAPPNPAMHRQAGAPVPLSLTARARTVLCPRCGSAHTLETSAFSATACKALFRCQDCLEPFEYVKEI